MPKYSFALALIALASHPLVVAADDGIPTTDPEHVFVDAPGECSPVAPGPCDARPCDIAPCDGLGCDGMPCDGDDLWTRKHLTGDDWRSGLAAHGIVYDARLTQFFQGVTSGGRREGFAYGGKLDQFVTLQGEKLGLNEGFSAIMHVETRFGDDVILDAAGAAPVNANLLYPSLQNTTAITGLQITQAFSEEWAVTFGKVNTFDLLNTIYPQSGRGIDGFMNASMLFPLTLARTVPLAFNGAGVLKLNEGRIQGALMVIDSQNTATTGADDLFDNGATILAAYRIFTELNQLPGSHLLLATYGDGQYTQLDPLGFVFFPRSAFMAPQESGSWSLTYFLEQQLWVDHCDKNRNIGLFSAWGWADDETSPFDWSMTASVQAHGLVPRRPLDSIGAGYFYTGLSSGFERFFPIRGVDDVQGFECFYNVGLAPWFHVTADLQVVEPALRTDDTAVVFGLRASIDI